jgi:tRNA pseudouridine55 synthase
MDGFLNLNKPQKFTSHDCVAKLRKILQTKKIGHGGTLDPSATGVLPIAVGKATRLLQFLPTEKAYRGTVKFGIVTATDDMEGEIIQQQSANHLTLAMVKPYLEEFLGKIEQIPPAFSAIKKDGKKMYDLARQGKEVEVPTREVEISQMEVLGWQEGEYPELSLEIHCSAGTYIRSIARDLGAKVGTGATLSSLERTLSCGMTIDKSLTFEEISTLQLEKQLNLINLDEPLEHLPPLELGETETQRWCYGQRIIWEENINDGFYRTYNQSGDFLGITEKYEDEGVSLIKAKVNVGQN